MLILVKSCSRLSNMEIDPATHADSAPVSFLNKFATIFTQADKVPTDTTEERLFTFFRTLSERDLRIRNVDDPAKTVGWRDEPQKKEGLTGDLKRVNVVGQNENTKTISDEMESREGFFYSDVSSSRPDQPKSQPDSNVKPLSVMCSACSELGNKMSDGSELGNKMFESSELGNKMSESFELGNKMSDSFDLGNKMSGSFELGNKKMAGKMESTAENSEEQQSKSPSTAGDELLEPNFTVKRPHENQKDYVEMNDQAQLCSEVNQEFVFDGVKESKELGEFTDIRENQTSLNMDSQDQSGDLRQKNTNGQDQSNDANGDKLSGNNPDQQMFMGKCNQVISPERNTDDAKIAHTEGRSNDQNVPLVCVNHVDRENHESTQHNEPTKISEPGESTHADISNLLVNSKNAKAPAESQKSVSDFNQTSTNCQDSSTVRTDQRVSMRDITEEDNAISPLTEVQMNVRSKEEACLRRKEQLDKSEQDLSTEVPAGHLSPYSERTGASSPDMHPHTRTVLITMVKVEQPSISGAGDCPSGDSSVASHPEGGATNTKADEDSAHTQSVSGKGPPSEREGNNSEGEKQEVGKGETSEDEKRETDSVMVGGPSSPVCPPGSPTTEGAPSPHPPSADTVQLQSLFSGRLQRGRTHEEKEAADQPPAPDQKAKPVRRGLFPKQSPTGQSPSREPGEPWGGFLEQLSQLLNLDRHKVEEKTEERGQTEAEERGQTEGILRWSVIYSTQSSI